MPQGPVAGYDALWFLCFGFGVSAQGCFLPFHIQKDKRESGHWHAQG